MLKPFALAWNFALAALLLAGCTSGDGPALGEVSGRVVCNGQALEDAWVMFKTTGAPGATGKTDADGRYRLTYGGAQPGAVVGLNQVSIFLPPDTTLADGNEQMQLLHATTCEVSPQPQTFDFDLAGKCSP